MTFDEWAITQNPKHRPHDDVEMVLRTVVRTHLVDDDSWDTEAETNKRMAQLLPDNAELCGGTSATNARLSG